MAVTVHHDRADDGHSMILMVRELCFHPMIHRQKNLHMQHKIGAIINLDDITHIDFLRRYDGKFRRQ